MPWPGQVLGHGAEPKGAEPKGAETNGKEPRSADPIQYPKASSNAIFLKDFNDFWMISMIATLFFNDFDRFLTNY